MFYKWCFIHTALFITLY